MYSPAPEAHVPHGPMRYAFSNALLHTLPVTSGYLSSYCLPSSLKQSSPSPMTSGINNAFSPEIYCSVDIFSFSDHFL